MNQPYVKRYDVNGFLLNPISEVYAPTGPNRKERRRREPRFMNNRAGMHIITVGTRKFRMALQLTKKGVIKHYLED